MSDPQHTGPRRPPRVSVVTTTYTQHRLPDIQELLDSLLTQSCQDFETIFVGEGDPALNDLVLDYARRIGLAEVRAVFNTGLRGLSPARNLGLSHARGDIIAFIDDDAVAFPDWVEGIVTTLESLPDAIGVTGPVHPRWQGEPLAWFPEEFLWMVSCSTAEQRAGGEPRRVRNVWGVNMAFRKEAFALCRFSETFIGGNQGRQDGAKAGISADEAEFCLRLAGHTDRPMYFSPLVRVYHKVHAGRLTPLHVRRRAFWEGYTKALLRRKFAQRMDQSPERAVLRRVVLHTLPGAARRVLTQPDVALRQLRLTSSVLFHAALGYVSANAPVVGPWIAQRYGTK